VGMETVQPEVQAVEQTEPAKGKPRGRPFVKGDPRIQPRNYAPQFPAPEEEIDPSLPPMLADMRRVYSTTSKADRTAAQRGCRKWLNRDPRGFMKELATLEAAVLKGQDKPADEGSKEPDLIIELAKEWLRQQLGTSGTGS
jgi:hypothetical protein